MTTYRLIFATDGIGEPKEVEFEADDASRALVIAHGEAADRPAELWRNGERVCTIRRKTEAGEFWQLS